MVNRITLFLYCLLVFFASLSTAKTHIAYVGGGHAYSTIQQAIDNTHQYQEVVVVIAPGVYQEKVFITRNNLTLLGVSPETTIIQKPILREHWRAENDNDWGAAVININATDINIVNLTIINNYGRLHATNEHQFAVRGFELSDRIITHNCRLIADGADTLSLWNKDGRYYHSHCYFEGATDMVCPRGRALIENSEFFNTKRSATLWHDGERNPAHKLVVSHSKFDGIEGFWLGRHHYDAQFYLLNSEFSEKMANKPIFRKQYNNKNKERPNLYGARYFFQGNTHADDLSWARDNFRVTDLIPAHYKDLSDWVFEGKWNPQHTLKRLSELIDKHQLTAVSKPHI